MTHKKKLIPIHLVAFNFWYQIWKQILLKREEESLASSFFNIICCQIWYQRKSDYMDRALGKDLSNFVPLVWKLFRVSPKFKMDVYTSELSVSLFPYHLIGSVDNGLPLMKWDGIGSLFVRQALLQRRPCVQQKESGSSHWHHLVHKAPFRFPEHRSYLGLNTKTFLDN